MNPTCGSIGSVPIIASSTVRADLCRLTLNLTVRLNTNVKFVEGEKVSNLRRRLRVQAGNPYFKIQL